MELFLTKFLPLLIYPLGLTFLLVASALLLSRHSRWQRLLLILALVILWLGSSRLVSMSLARSLEWRYLPPEQVPIADVIVVLGGGTEPAAFPRPLVEVNGAGDRILYAFWLYKQGAAPKILLSGGGIEWLSPHSSPAEEMFSLLSLMGVPAEAMWLDKESKNTYENAFYSQEILEEKGIKKIMLVTSASHMPRALKLYQAQEFEVIPMPTDFLVTSESWRQLTEPNLQNQLLNLLPGVGDLSLTTRMLKEYLGMVYYELRGWQ